MAQMKAMGRELDAASTEESLSQFLDDGSAG